MKGSCLQELSLMRSFCLFKRQCIYIYKHINITDMQ
jgi:hypothetical protein